MLTNHCDFARSKSCMFEHANVQLKTSPKLKTLSHGAIFLATCNLVPDVDNKTKQKLDREYGLM